MSERNGAMQPSEVWLNFIPVFSLAWMFVTVIKIRDSARAEFAFRGLRMKEDMGFGAGMTFEVISVISGVYIPPEQVLNDRRIMQPGSGARGRKDGVAAGTGLGLFVHNGQFALKRPLLSGLWTAGGLGCTIG